MPMACFRSRPNPSVEKVDQINEAKLDLSFDKMERVGLTSEQVEKLYKKWGYNEIPECKTPLWYAVFSKHLGTLPLMLEVGIIIAAATQKWIDFGILLGMLLINFFIVFHEESKSAAASAPLTNKMERKIPTLRDGRADYLHTRLLVPGDVVMLMGGMEVPADIEWMEGDVLSIDTAALTGEPLPRKYPSDAYGKLILAGTLVRAGEAYGIVRKTGVNTEVGSGQADIAKDRSAPRRASIFEDRVHLAVRIVFVLVFVDVAIILLVIGLGRPQLFSKQYNCLDDTAGTPCPPSAQARPIDNNGIAQSGVAYAFDVILSVIIASIPLALPLVLNATMALGARRMATEFDAVVTSLPALQDIGAMTVFCSDKTGTLKTAKITIHAESVWPCGDFTKEDAALFAGLASNRDKKEDAIDRSIINHFDRVFGQAKAMQLASEYTKVRTVGFNPTYKRVLYTFTHRKHGAITIAKGLPNKILDTADGGADDAQDQWQCRDHAALKDTVRHVDSQFSKLGYKTIAVAIKIRDGPFQFVGILPMFDPPRHDTEITIQRLAAAGVEVKMLTGEHLNVARETARLIGMGANIRAGEDTREDSAHRDMVVLEANGFAQVLPRDKREVVLVLRNRFNIVVGVTGDGVGCAPTMSASQVGVAVDDATDAAKNAAAVVLTAPGLSAVYSAVVESRRILKHLKSYVIFRFASIFHVVVVLNFLIFINTCSINSTYIVLLALASDVISLPIAYDLQPAPSKPENADVVKILLTSCFLGLVQAGLSLLFAYGAGSSGIAEGIEYTMTNGGPTGIGGCEQKLQALIWMQMLISSQLLVFSTRAPSYIWVSIRPSIGIALSVLLALVVGSVICEQASQWGHVDSENILLTWLYDLVCLVLVDACKVFFTVHVLHETADVLPDYTYVRSCDEDLPLWGLGQGDVEISERVSLAASRLTEWAIPPSERQSVGPGLTASDDADDESKDDSPAHCGALESPIGVGTSETRTAHPSGRQDQELKR